MQILEGDLLRKMNSSRTKREIKGRKKEREQEETRDKRTKEKKTRAGRKRTRAGRKKERHADRPARGNGRTGTKGCDQPRAATLS